MSPERDEVALPVRHLDTDGRAPRDRSEDAHIRRRHGVGDVLVEARDAGDLHSGGELELVPGDRRANGHPDEPRLDAVGGERRLEHPAGLLDQPLVDLLGGAPCEQVERRQLPRSLCRRRTERDLELLDDELFVLAVVVGVLVVERDIELVLGVLLAVVFVLVFLVGVVDHRDQLGGLPRLAHVDHRAIADAESLSRER